MAQVIFPAIVVPGSTADPSEPTSPSDGQIWVDTDGTAPTTVVTRWSKSPTNGTTTLSGTDDTTNTLAYTPGYEQVFLNGVLLSRGSDYTATTGTSVVLSAATITSDIVEIIAALQVAYTDTITTAAAATTYVAKALTTTTGDIIYASAANTPARLGIGSSAQVLNVSGGIPAWTTLTAGGLTSIASGSFSGSSTLISSIPTSYKQLLLQIDAWYLSSTGWGLYLRLNDDSTASRYYNSAAFATTGQTAFNAAKLELTMDNFGLTTAGYGSVTCYLPNYASTTAYKQAIITGVGQGNSSNPTYFTYQANGGIYNQLTAITSLRINNGAGATQNGTYTLYGVS